VSLQLLLDEESNSFESEEKKLHNRKFQTELALGTIDKLLMLQKPIEQLREVRLEPNTVLILI
jgi:hypothetical protein